MTFVASDGILLDTEIVELTIINTNGPPVISPVGDREVTVGKDLYFTVLATDPDDEGQVLTYSASNLPVGGQTSATFNPITQLFDWSPLTGDIGVYSGVVFSVTDGLEETQESITVTVNPNRPPVLSSIGSQTSNTNTLIVIQLSATDPDGPQPDTLTYFAHSLPSDASFNPSTGRFEWSSGQREDITVTFGVTDGEHLDTEQVKIKVLSSTSVDRQVWQDME